MAASKDLIVSVNKFMEGCEGRDKIMKMCQYGGKVGQWIYFADQKGADYNKWLNLDKSATEARKFMRLLKTLQEVHKFRVSGHSLTLLSLLTDVRGVLYGLYYLCDHVSYLTKYKFLQGDLKQATKRTQLCFMIGLIVSIILDTYKILIERQKLSQTARVSEPEVRAKAAAAFKDKVHEYRLTTLKNIADLNVQITNYFELKFVSIGWVGLCGLVSALIGSQSVWSKLK
eukprot:TRINITY_DN5219_c0_g4_i1.p1 TRINITY_DN5219_c0_g4~~TRINITY_DN5219_c0_g4_i1.p1  ORF type:complete len:229 (-),score=56.44 TRINITY_DN5219_c0_g4_i1:108-794(-)